jgi:hypothetical protein
LAAVVAVPMVLALGLVLMVVLVVVERAILAPPAVLVHLVKEITEVLATLFLKFHLWVVVVVVQALLEITEILVATTLAVMVAMV